MEDYMDHLHSQVKTGNAVFIAPNATVIGDVSLGDNVSVWFGAVIRGDIDSISIGENSNIQDNCVIHVDQGFPVKVGSNVTVGHSAIIHGAEIGDGSLIGMGATVLNNAKIGKRCIIGANALVPQDMVIPDFSIAVGIPAKIIKSIPENERGIIPTNVGNYINLAKKYLNI